MKEIAGHIISDSAILACCQLTFIAVFALIMIPTAKMVDNHKWDVDAIRAAMEICIAILIIIGISGILAVHCLPKMNMENYTVYLDGREIDVDTIDISMYHCSVDQDRQMMFLTKK